MPLNETKLYNDFFGGNRLFVIFFVVTSFKELALDILPQISSVVVFVESVDSRVKESLENEGTAENGGNINGVSLEQSRKLERVSIRNQEEWTA